MELPDFFADYYCVFVCEPELNSPYGLFATKGQAKIWRKELETRYPMGMVIVPEREWPEARRGFRSDARPCEVWRSRNFLAQIYKEERGIRVSVCRTMLKDNGQLYDNISWDELMQIKREIGAGASYAVEVLPPDEHAINVANMRHFWILPGEFIVGWKRNQTVIVDKNPPKGYSPAELKGE